VKFDISVMDKIILFLKASKLTVFNRIETLQVYTNYSRIIKWGKLIGLAGSMQLVGRGLGVLSGILIIRFLPVQEYALYTLANTMLATMNLLADGGISAGVMSNGGKVWTDRKELGKVVGTGLELRNKFTVVSLIISIPILMYLLRKHDASWIMTSLITLSLIPAFYAELSDSIYSVVPKLHQDIKRLEKNGLAVAFGRLFLTASFIFVFPFTYLALLANGIPRIYGNIRIRKIAGSFAEISKESDPGVRRNLLKTVKRMMPGLVYVCVSGQITIWLISVFGNTTALAQLGALGRLAVVLSLFSGLISILVVPRYARLIAKKAVMFKYYVQIIAAVFFLVCLVIVAVYVFADEILFVIGENYAGLQPELMLAILGSGLSLIASMTFSLNISRDWVMNPSISVSISLASLVVGVFLFDVTTLQGVLIYNIFLAAVQLTLNGFYGMLKIKRLKVPEVEN